MFSSSTSHSSKKAQTHLPCEDVKVITSTWFDQIGIVVGETDRGEWKTYMKHLNYTSTPQIDVQYILDYGYKIPVEAACGFFPEIAEELRTKAEKR